MTQDINNLRDARLKKALAHAPDALDEPSQAIRNAIKSKAIGAVKTRTSTWREAKPRWWKRYWVGTGGANNPWSAAFATVLLGSIITLIWHGQEVPDATLDDRPAASPQVKSKETPVYSSSAPAPAALPAPALEPAPSIRLEQTPTSPVAKQAAPPLLKRAQTPSDTPSAATAKSAEKTERRAEIPENTVKLSEAPSELAASRHKEAVPSAPSAPVLPYTAAAEVRSAPAPVPAPPAVVAQAPSPPVTAAPALAAPAPAAPAPPMAAGRASVLADRVGTVGRFAANLTPAEWAAMDVAYLGRNARLSKTEGQVLADRMQALVAAATSDGAAGALGSLLLRLSFVDQVEPDTVARGGLVATFELWENRFRWRRADGSVVMGVPRADLAASLLQAAARAMPP